MQTLAALVPVLFVITLGFGAGRLRIVDNIHVDGVNTIVMSIALPLSLFTTLATATRGDVLSHLPLAGVVLAVTAVVYAATFAFSVRRGPRRPPVAAVQALTVAFPNAAAVGLPLAEALLGRTGMLAVAVTLAVGSTTLSPLTLVILERTGSATDAAERSLGRSVRTALVKPVVIAPILGLAVSTSGLPLPSIVESALTEMGSITAGLALFLTGLVLSAERVRIGLEVIVATLVGGVARPLLAFAAVGVSQLPQPMAAEAVLMLALPSGFFGILLGLRYRVTSETAGSTLLLSTALSVPTLPLVVALLPAP